MKVPRRTVLKGALLLAGCGAATEIDFENDETDEDEMTVTLDDAHPVVLRSSTTISANSDSEVNASPLTNASGEPMEIHEFIFSVRPSDDSLAKYASSGLFPSGGQFAIGLAIKDGSEFGYALTNGVIPLWSFGQARQLGQEEIVQTFQKGGGAAITVRSFMVAVYSWKLDHPLYVPPGARIVPVTRSLGSFNGAVELGITAIGKILPNTPMSRASYKMPWVCSYLSKSFEFNAAGQDTSSDNTLYNPFVDKPVTIERFVGRLHCFTSINVSPDGTSLLGVPEVTCHDTSFFDFAVNGVSSYGTPNTANNYYSQLLSIRMRDSVGNPIVREKTLFRNVFEPATRTWECQHVLPPRQFHKVDFYKDLTTATSTLQSRLQASVASIGWREVSWKKAA